MKKTYEKIKAASVAVLALLITNLTTEFNFYASAESLYEIKTSGNLWYYSIDDSFKNDNIEVLKDGKTIDYDFKKSPDEVIQDINKDNEALVDIYVEKEIIGSVKVKIGLKGDANLDGKLNIYDASAIAKSLASVEELKSEFCEFLADSNNDGKLNIYDASAISKELVESIPDNQNNKYINEVLRLVNIERAKNKLPNLTIDKSLNKVAQIRAEEISTFESGLGAHKRPDGTMWNTILPQHNIKYSYAGENLAGGQKTPKDVVNAWMNSEGHKKNILSSKFKSIGIGYYYDLNSNYKTYWVQIFTG